MPRPGPQPTISDNELAGTVAELLREGDLPVVTVRELSERLDYSDETVKKRMRRLIGGDGVQGGKLDSGTWVYWFDN